MPVAWKRCDACGQPIYNGETYRFDGQGFLHPGCNLGVGS